MKITTTQNGLDYEIEMDSRPAGKMVKVWTWDGERYEKVSETIHPLSTYFECLYLTIGDLFGETVDAEKLAYEHGMEIRSQDDADCVKCGRIVHYSEMILGANVTVHLDELGLGNWDYVCADCYHEHFETCTVNN